VDLKVIITKVLSALDTMRNGVHRITLLVALAEITRYLFESFLSGFRLEELESVDLADDHLVVWERFDSSFRHNALSSAKRTAESDCSA